MHTRSGAPQILIESKREAIFGTLKTKRGKELGMLRGMPKTAIQRRQQRGNTRSNTLKDGGLFNTIGTQK